MNNQPPISPLVRKLHEQLMTMIAEKIVEITTKAYEFTCKTEGVKPSPYGVRGILIAAANIETERRKINGRVGIIDSYSGDMR